MFEEEVLIPKARIAVLIGPKGSVKKSIEKRGKAKLKIHSNGLVQIRTSDALSLQAAKNVVEAIGRGFNPELAKKLFREDFGFELIRMRDYAKPSALKRLRGVLIGTKGKMRRAIELSTNTHISIYGKTVGIIGPLEAMAKAHKAIEMLLTGAKHSAVYHFLEES